jgi:hypothetical protein
VSSLERPASRASSHPQIRNHRLFGAHGWTLQAADCSGFRVVECLGALVKTSGAEGAGTTVAKAQAL